MSLQWSPHDPKQLLIINAQNLAKLWNYITGAMTNIPFEKLSRGTFHPRDADSMIFGDKTGDVFRISMKALHKKFAYNIEHELRSDPNDSSILPTMLFYEHEVLDIVMNPGEDVFLVVFKNNKLALFAM